MTMPKSPANGSKPRATTAQPHTAGPRRWIRLAALACLLVAAFYVALPSLRSAPESGGDASRAPQIAGSPAPGASSPAAQQEAAYQADVAALQALARDESADAQARADAGAALAALVERHGLQADLTAALQALGYAPCLALYQNDALTLMLAAERLDSAQSAAILSLCLTHLPVRAENVRIVTGASLE